MRDALLMGLELQHSQGFNPYRFGFIGSSDTHNTGGAYEEPAYHGKIGILDGRPEWRSTIPNKDDPELNRLPGITTTGFDWSASGAGGGLGRGEHARSDLCGVPAQGNLRHQRPEDSREILRRLRPRRGRRKPAVRHRGPDGRRPRGAPGRCSRASSPGRCGIRRARWLQRLQIVKGWLDDGAPQERVYDVACGDGLEPSPDSHRCPDNDASVDLATLRLRLRQGRR